jgi:ketosteroid isomerase-like protein
MTNTETVQKIYAAFGRGDLPAILEHLAESVEWEYGGSPDDVPWLLPRRGREGAAQFFGSLAALEFQRFETKTLLEGSGMVVALIDIEATVKANGRRIRETDEVHIFHFDGAGRVVKFRHRVDTAQHRAAFRGE